MSKTFPILRNRNKSDEWCIEVTDNCVRQNYINRVDSKWSHKYYTIATKQNPTENILYWNEEERQLVNYLKKHKIGKYSVETKPNYDEDPYGNKVERGEKTTYKFDFSDLWK